MKKKLLLLFILIFTLDLHAKENDKNNTDKYFGIALNFYGAEPFPSLIGITSQVTAVSWLRLCGGWGFANRDGGSGSSVGIAAKFFPYTFDYPNNISISPLVGISGAKYSSNDLILFGVLPNTTVYSFDLGAELRTPTLLDIGLGIIVPVNTGFTVPYTRLILKLW